MNKKALENFVWFQFADDVDMDLRKRVSTDFEQRYDKAKYVSFNEFIKEKVFTIQEVWKAKIKNDVRDIDKNPSQDMAEVKLRQWQRLSYVNDVVMNAYVKIMIELVNDKSSQAYIHLYKQLDKKSYNNAELGFQWQPNIKRLSKLFLELQRNTLIDKESDYESFKNALNGIILTEIEPIKFICSNSLVVYLFDQLQKHKFINGKMANSNKLIQHTTGIKNVAQTRYNTEITKKGVPQNSTLVDNILKDL
jgi:hypothetical protein